MIGGRDLRLFQVADRLVVPPDVAVDAIDLDQHRLEGLHDVEHDALAQRLAVALQMGS